MAMLIIKMFLLEMPVHHIYCSAINNSQGKELACTWIEHIPYVNVCFLTLKKNKVMWFTRKQMEVELILLVEMNQTQNMVSHVFSHV